MPRRPRVFLPGHPVHVVQRGNNRGTIFFGPKDAQNYLDWLREAATEHGVAVHAYVLMTNHIHLLVSPETAHALPRAMRHVNWRYSRYVNESQGRTGSLWEGRYRASLIEADAYFFACSRYIELNPVRAGMAATPAAYRWSSYKANAEGKADPVVAPHQLYTDLAATADQRAMAYRGLFDGALPEDALGAIRDAINGGWPLGRASFTALVSRHAGRPITRRKRR
ncbi:MAG: transposase [Rhodospirillaceae bacterium]|nr:transposase [Rhodospirillaceae bacterium]